MKFKLVIRQYGEFAETEEDYDRPEIETPEQAQKWAEETVDRFNESLRPGETARVLVAVRWKEEQSDVHAWGKTNLVTIIGGGSFYDTYRCERCGITGKRFGLSERVERDRRYQAAKYAVCRPKEGE